MVYCESCRAERDWPGTDAQLATCDICALIAPCYEEVDTLLPTPEVESDIDFEWIAQQMHVEAAAIDIGRRPPTCYWCGKPGPGLYWLPSEEGVIEMAVWNCDSCIVKHTKGL